MSNWSSLPNWQKVFRDIMHVQSHSECFLRNTWPYCTIRLLSTSAHTKTLPCHSHFNSLAMHQVSTALQNAQSILLVDLPWLVYLYAWCYREQHSPNHSLKRHLLHLLSVCAIDAWSNPPSCSSPCLGPTICSSIFCRTTSTLACVSALSSAWDPSRYTLSHTQ